MRERFSIFSLCVAGLFVLCSVGFVGCSPDEDDGDDVKSGYNNNGQGTPATKTCSMSCGSAKYCDTSSGQCVVKKVAGLACESDIECASNICDSNTKMCIRPALGGEECSTASECQTGICNDGICGCKVAADCLAGDVCDDGTCRPVIDCPGNNSGKCFKAFQLTPSAEDGKAWNVGPISDIRKDEGDFLGSAFTVSLPIEHVITCPYLIPKYDEFASIKGLSTYKDTNGDDYAARIKSGCYQLDMENQIPFTLLVNGESKWKERNFIFEFIVNDSNLMNDNEKFTLWMAPSYSLKKTDHIKSTTLSATSLDFPLGKDKQSSIFTRYEHSKCVAGGEDNSYEDKMAQGRTNCSDAYQVKVELLHRTQNPNWTCDELYNTLLGCDDVLCNYSKTEEDVLKTDFSSYAKVDDLCIKIGDDKKPKKSDDGVELDSKCSDYYSYLTLNPADPTSTEKQPRTCRTAKILLGGIRAYIEVKDDEISTTK